MIDVKNLFSLSIFVFFSSELWPLIYGLSFVLKYFFAGYDACLQRFYCIFLILLVSAVKQAGVKLTCSQICMAFTNIVDSDETPQNMTSNQGVRILQKEK